LKIAVLSCYDAPDDIVNMTGEFALYFKRAFYRGINVSAGIPLKNILLPSPGVGATGNLLRYGAVVFVFTAEGVQKDMKYKKARTDPHGRITGDRMYFEMNKSSALSPKRQVADN
jgi:hypothetical protein